MDFKDTTTQVLCTIVLVRFIYKLIQMIFRHQNLHLPPGPRGFPILGSFGELSGKTLMNHKDLYGDISYVNMFGTDIVILNSPEAICEAFTQTDGALDNRPVLFVTKYIMTSDMAFQSPNLPYWKLMRKIMHSAIKSHGRGITEVEPLITDELVYFETKLRESRESVDLMEFLKPSVTNFMYILVAGERFEYGDRMNELPLSFLDKFNYMATPSVDNILQTFPWIRYTPLKMGQMVREMIHQKAEITRYLYTQHRHLSAAELDERAGIAFQMMLKQRQNDDFIAEENIQDAILDIFAGGIITPVSSLYFFFLLMVIHPDVQRQIHAEIDDIIGDARRPTLADKSSMPYTQATLLELLRYTSNTPLSLPRACAKLTKLREFDIPKDSVILTNFFRIFHDPDLWENPWRFDPSRFLDEYGDLLPVSHQRRRNLTPFGAGTRICVGELFAKNQMFLYVSHLLQRFEFVSADDVLTSCDPRDIKTGIVIFPENYSVKVIERIK